MLLEYMVTYRFVTPMPLINAMDSVVKYFMCYRDFNVRELEMVKGLEERNYKFRIIASGNGVKVMIHINEMGEVDISARGIDPDKLKKLICEIVEYLGGKCDGGDEGKDK